MLRCAGVSLVLLAASSFLSAEAASGPPTLPTKAGPHSVARLACPKKPTTTVAIEACQARQLLQLDGNFNRKGAVLWSVLDAAGRQSFARAHRVWLTYRRQECDTEAKALSGGSAAPVMYGACEIELTAARIRRLAHTIALYCQGKVRTGRFRRCPR